MTEELQMLVDLLQENTTYIFVITLVYLLQYVVYMLAWMAFFVWGIPKIVDNLLRVFEKE